ncbi:hypothetical protein COV81_00105 [Candidatus Peregrinibacteria bacterium CG11_big_fil_rev_8_21_14_0_20_41_10]|nr:MAG: hypothetical protein COV81_00105 [Candidatus Peregrinibacteria bacterium CG11_big_fil_rev_8_21_14_0_20_41_10]PIZ73351.1 MAG: hypothetical protein COY06_05550 [Candidatus Peregrinibacteria bacterium CG_4_10_14_0_2_um_filter_41_8]PJC38047.1 MAG: hypothetical protein CO045_02300 [Candidatus Peregrinibacteria bacterium CG_4_9_14_0_2_um_filter_41_14]
MVVAFAVEHGYLKEGQKFEDIRHTLLVEILNFKRYMVAKECGWLLPDAEFDKDSSYLNLCQCHGLGALADLFGVPRRVPTLPVVCDPAAAALSARVMWRIRNCTFF